MQNVKNNSPHDSSFQLVILKVKKQIYGLRFVLVEQNFRISCVSRKIKKKIHYINFSIRQTFLLVGPTVLNKI